MLHKGPLRKWHNPLKFNEFKANQTKSHLFAPNSTRKALFVDFEHHSGQVSFDASPESKKPPSAELRRGVALF